MVRPQTIIVFDPATQMPDHVRQADYFHVAIPDKPGEAARVLALLSRAGVNMIGFCGFPRGVGKSQLDFIAEDSAAFKRAAKDLGFKLSAKKQAFVIQGTDRPGAIAAVLNALAQHEINVTSIQAVSSGEGDYGALVWVQEADVRRAAKALAGLSSKESDEKDIVDAASEQSFPASDPPPWN